MTGYPLGLQQEIITRSGVGIDTSLSYCHYSLNDSSLADGGFIELCASKVHPHPHPRPHPHPHPHPNSNLVVDASQPMGRLTVQPHRAGLA